MELELDERYLREVFSFIEHTKSSKVQKYFKPLVNSKFTNIGVHYYYVVDKFGLLCFLFLIEPKVVDSKVVFIFHSLDPQNRSLAVIDENISTIKEIVTKRLNFGESTGFDVVSNHHQFNVADLLENRTFEGNTKRSPQDIVINEDNQLKPFVY